MILFHSKPNGLTISVGGNNYHALIEELRIKAGYAKDELFAIGSRMSYEELSRIADDTDKQEYDEANKLLAEHSS